MSKATHTRPAIRPDRFKTLDGPELFESWYHRRLKRLPLISSSQVVETTTGDTHVLAFAGPEAHGTPVVFLHGLGVSAPATSGFYIEMAKRRPVYAVDMPGQTGATAARAPKLGNGDAGAWLASLLQGMGLERAVVYAVSHGARHALELAQDHPEHVAALALVVPAGLCPADLRTAARFVASSAWFRYRRDRKSLLRVIRPMFGLGGAPPAWLVEYARMLADHAKIDLTPVPVMPEGALTGLEAPTLVVTTEMDPVFRPGAVRAGAHRVLPPHTEIQTMRDMGHFFRDDEFTAIETVVGKFLDARLTA